MNTVLCWWLLMLGVVLEARQLGFREPQTPDLGFRSNPSDRYQTWSEWMRKRGLGSQEVPLGMMVGLDRGQFPRWSELSRPLNPSKRQLTSAPDHFGLYSRYFTNGLQDWRSTFDGGNK